MMKKKIWIIPLILLSLLVIYFVFYNEKATTGQSSLVITKAERGLFLMSVKATGELQAKNSKRIMGPSGMNRIGIYQTTIDNLIPEGSVVKKGDFIASLNRSDIANKMQEISSEIDKIQTQLEQAKIDTAIELRGIRDQIANLEFTKKEKELISQQSKYEPQMILRQAQLDLERTQRDLDQNIEKLVLKEQQAKAKISEINTTLQQQVNKLRAMEEVANEFTIFAPDEGMVIYYKTWRGKVAAGSQIDAWDPIVAELPDLSDMISKSYVNEVDINKIKPGLDVELRVDALPEKTYKGKVLQVANVGEELRGFDSKVFEVTIQVLELDTMMRPAMTTGAEIMVDEFKDAISIPLEALFTDSLNYVFKLSKSGLIKQEVIPGMSSDTRVIIEHGLDEGEEVYLSIPANADKLQMIFISDDIKEQIENRLLAEKEQRAEAYRKKREEIKDIDLPQNQGGRSGGIRIFR